MGKKTTVVVEEGKRTTTVTEEYPEFPQPMMMPPGQDPLMKVMDRMASAVEKSHGQGDEWKGP
ncbi:MAG: hypothetical protein ACREJD_05785 [Phycisphaerales bacterium]